ncbi:MAG: GFA family protein [Candidatus Thiodiazotropha sp.]
MADNHEVTGSCLCGAVGYAISGNLGIFQYCHCSRCRKSSGGAFAANLIVAPEQFRWLRGEASVGRYELPTAKHFATGFCKVCGSTLPWLAQSGKAVVVPAGSLDEDPGIRPMQNIFYASRAIWHTDPASLPSFDELPVRPGRRTD